MRNNVIILHRYGHLLNLARSHNQEEEEEGFQSELPVASFLYVDILLCLFR